MTLRRARQARGRVNLVRELSNGLAAHIHTLPDDVWRNAAQYGSPCAGWKLADVITHLVAGANMLSLSIARALKSQTGPPMGYRRLTGEEAIADLVSLRDTYDEDLFPEFNASCRRLSNMLVALDADGMDAPAFHPAGVMPVSRLVDMRALELAVHGWDIRYTLDRSSTLPPGALPFLCDWLPNWLSAAFRAGEPLDALVTYRFALTDKGAAARDVVVRGDGFSMEDAGDAPADVTFACDTDTHLLFCMGRLPFARSVRRGRLSFEGDERQAARFTDWFGPV